MNGRFQQSDYLRWYLPRIRQDRELINLHASGVPSVSPDTLTTLRDGDPFETASRFERRLAGWLGIPPDELLFTPGATGGTLLALLSLADRGRGLVVEQPIYEPMLRQAERLGRVSRLVRRFEDRWRFPLDEARRIIDRDTAVVMITEPHNPSGCRSPREDVLDLARLAARQDALLLINEVYCGFGNAPSHHGLAPNIVVVSGLSKLLGAYWARLGWLSGPAEIIEQLRWAHLHQGMPSSPGARIGLSFLAEAEKLRARAVALAHTGRECVVDWVTATDGLTVHPPAGPGFAAVRLPEGTGDLTLASRLFDEQDVLVIPGTLFEAPGTLRISWLQSAGRLEEGLQRVAEMLTS